MATCSRVAFTIVFTFFFFLIELTKLCRCGNITFACSEQERAALLKFKSSFINSSSHVLLSSWKGEACCKWKGVGCDHGHVVKLDLYNRCYHLHYDDSYYFHDGSSFYDGYYVGCFYNKSFQLTAKAVGTSLQQLKHLNYLDLRGNDFQWSQIPSFLGSMQHLRYLNLSYCQFSGQVPHHLGNLTNLQILDLKSYSQGLRGDFSWVSQLSSLQYIDMSGVQLNTHTLMQVIYQLPSLVEVYLEDCGIDNLMIPLESVNSSFLTRVQVLNLGSNSLSGPLPSAMRNLTSIRVLDLSNNYLATIPSWLGEFKNLVHLYLGWNGIVGSIPNALQNMTSIRVLDLSANHLATIPSWLGEFKNLVHLHLGSNRIVGSIPNALQNMTSLKFLDLSFNGLQSSIQPTLPTILRNSCNLKSLDFSDNGIRGEKFGKENFSACVTYDLEELDLSHNDFNGKLPSTWLGKYENLKSLNLASNSIHGSIPESLSKLTNLRELDLRNNQINGTIPSSLGRLSSLTALDISSNHLSGSIPESLGRLSSLTALYISSNQLSGSIPDSLGQLLNVRYLDLSNNSLEGTLDEIHLGNLSFLEALNVGLNNLTVMLRPDWSPPFQLYELDLQSCKIEIEFPQWLETQKHLLFLDLSNTGIWGTIPKWAFLLYELNLSNNKISGTLPENIGDKIADTENLVLANNLINGSIPNSLCKLRVYGNLDLSKNLLSGKIPDCLWQINGQILNLSFNELSGSIPTASQSGSLLYEVESLDLSNNKLHGELPLALAHMGSLAILDLGDNQFSGIIPSWIGENPQMQILRLRGNKFNGSIPWSLCNLHMMRVLDLADNDLTSSIPICFAHLKGMTIDKSSNYEYEKRPSTSMPPMEASAPTLMEASAPTLMEASPTPASAPTFAQWDNEDVKQVMKGIELDYTRNLQFLVNMDLSKNSLSGTIPEGLTLLSGLIGMNLSDNYLSGKIPSSIQKMKSLESIDFSNNQLSGPIPRSTSTMDSLGHLNLSYNDFSGPIPRDNHFLTFDEQSYIGNPHLCGEPLKNKCPGTDEVPTSFGYEDNYGNGDKKEKILFYFVIALGFIIGFWAVIGTLLLKKNWRHAYFRYAEKVADKIYVVVRVRAARLKMRMRKE